MVDGRPIVVGAEPLTTNVVVPNSDPSEDQDGIMMEAAARVAAVHERCVSMNDDTASRDPAFAISALERRAALEALMSVPAWTPESCSVKLDMLLQIMPWMGDEDTELFHCFVVYAQEVTTLFRNSVGTGCTGEAPRRGV
jgi:hypothetical protein